MAKLEQIQAKMNQLQAQADALISKKAQAAVNQIRDIMLKHDLTTADIEVKAKATRAAKEPKLSTAAGKTKVSSNAKAKAVPKYQHPKTGATWTGRGRAPAWIAEAKDRRKFLIASGAEATVATTTGAVSKVKSAVKMPALTSVGATGGKGQRKGPQPALYRDPKSGATWSGRGPAPAWLAGAKDRSRFLIDGAAAVASEAGAVSKASKLKSAGKSGVVAKKGTAPQKVATKAPAEKDFAESKKAVASAAKKSAAKKMPVRKARAVKTADATANAITAPESATVEASA